jgi:hypothetical protein
MRRWPISLVPALLAVLGSAPEGLAQEPWKRNLLMLEYPGFPGAHSSWGSIGYNRTHKKVVVGVTNHLDRCALYEYDVRTKTLTLRGFVPEMAHLRDFQWQGKIHSQMTEGPDGATYFSTDGGEVRHLYLMDHPRGYGGGFIFRWDLGTQQLTSLGMGLPYDSVKDLVVDPVGGLLYGTTFPQVHFVVYDPRKNDLRDLGRLGSGHVPRVVFTDKWGNGYYTDWRQRLVKYERATGRLVFARDPLPAFPGTPGHSIITGVTAYAVDAATGTIYLVTFGSKVLAFHPTEKGIGRVEDLGGLYDGDKPLSSYYCPNLAFARNGKLYYFIGGHDWYAIQGRLVLMEMDPRTRQKRLLASWPTSEINEVTGADVKDEEGNLYFTGRKDVPSAEARGESGASRPFLIVFNPEKALR